MANNTGKGGCEGWRKYTKEEVIAALVKAGTQSGAAKLLKANRQTIINYMKEDPEISMAVKEAKEILLDVAETMLADNIRKGHASSIFFYLKTQGKQRGYVERVESTGPDGAPVAVEYSLTGSKDALADKFAALEDKTEEKSEDQE